MKKKPSPLAQGLEEYIGKGMSRLHMPGHKGSPLAPFGKLLAYDVTEIEGTDNLYQAEGIIRQTEERFARLYGSRASLLSAGGSTLCIQAMLTLIAKEGGKVIAGRNIHAAAVNAMGLLGLEPVWIYPRKEEGEPLIGRILPQDVEEALSRHPDALGVYITSPDYFGVISDISGISCVCRRFGVPLLVDNAHGAHLKFLKSPAPLHPLEMGADLCCDSLHKTLPVITGGALLQIAGEDFLSRAKEAMSLFGSTSPSYLIMLSAAACLEELEDSLPARMEETVHQVEGLKQLAREKGFLLPDFPCDPMRLTLCLSPGGISGKAFDIHLKNHDIQAEFVSDSGCVLLFSPYNSSQDFSRVRQAILSVPLRRQAPVSYPILPPSRRLSLREAILSEKEELPTGQAAGRISAQIKTPCPPGIPLIMPGEEITPEAIPLLLQYGIQTINVVKSS